MQLINTVPDQDRTASRTPSGSRRAELARILGLTLSITQSTTEDQLLRHTLAAVSEVTGARAAIARRPEEPAMTRGAAELIAQLLAGVREPHRVGELATGSLGHTIIVAAAGAGQRLGPEARKLFSMIIAHAETCLERLRELDRLTRRADSDPLTGLRHYRPFGERLARGVPGRTAVLALDVDSFKKINDEWGHQAGDTALVCLVGGLRAVVRDQDALYRIGGDEFAVVVDVNAPAEAEAIANRLLVAARRVGPTVSIGVAMHRDDESGQQTLLRADMAMYEAKRCGKDTVRLAAA